MLLVGHSAETAFQPGALAKIRLRRDFERQQIAQSCPIVALHMYNHVIVRSSARILCPPTRTFNMPADRPERGSTYSLRRDVSFDPALGGHGEGRPLSTKAAFAASSLGRGDRRSPSGGDEETGGRREPGSPASDDGQR